MLVTDGADAAPRFGGAGSASAVQSTGGDGGGTVTVLCGSDSDASHVLLGLFTAGTRGKQHRYCQSVLDPC